MLFFLKALIIGFAIAAPVGPIGVLCIQRSLQQGFKMGLMTGLGAALADGVYGLIAGLGLTVISSFLIAEEKWIRLGGGLFLIYLGIKIFFSKPNAQTLKTSPSNNSAFKACATTFFLTLTNPMTILSFIAVFAGLGLGSEGNDFNHALMLVAGITLGSACWWFLLSGGIAFILHHRMNPKTLRAINYLSGVIMLTFGLFAL